LTVSCHWLSDGVNSRYARESRRSKDVAFNKLKDGKRPIAAPHPNQPIPVFCHNLAMQFTVAQLDDAYTWLCRGRRHFPPDADIWWFANFKER